MFQWSNESQWCNGACDNLFDIPYSRASWIKQFRQLVWRFLIQTRSGNKLSAGITGVSRCVTNPRTLGYGRIITFFSHHNCDPARPRNHTKIVGWREIPASWWAAVQCLPWVYSPVVGTLFRTGTVDCEVPPRPEVTSLTDNLNILSHLFRLYTETR